MRGSLAGASLSDRDWRNTSLADEEIAVTPSLAGPYSPCLLDADSRAPEHAVQRPCCGAYLALGAMDQFRFKCATCDLWHEGMPTFGASAPLHYFFIPEAERETRCHLSSDDCVIDDELYFVRGCIEIAVHGSEEPFAWGAWVSLSRESYETFREAFPLAKRAHFGPFFGWLSAALPLYPDTENLKTMVHLRDNGIRPRIELEPTDHPLAIEQRAGIEASRVSEIYSYFVHRNGA